MQNEALTDPSFEDISNRLGLSEDEEGLLRCRGRIIGENPLYLPSKHAFTKLVIEDAHLKTLHGGVTLTMAKTREIWWIEKLRTLVKGVLHKCEKCKCYRTQPLPPPPAAALPEFRTEGSRAFQTVGVDFAGPLEYKVSKNIKAKSYVALYTCATTRAVHLDLLTDMTAGEFKRSLTEFIARRGNPVKMVSDNGKTFVTTAKLLDKLRKNQLINDYLAKINIRWQFNLSRSPLWGGFFEKMVGLMKSALRKAVGQANLTYKQLKEVLITVEVILNNRPLGCLEDDTELPPLTPNGLIHGINISLPEENTEALDEETKLSRYARYIKRCKDIVWKRWSCEYVKALREKHHISLGKAAEISTGDIMLIKGEEKDRGLWKIGVVEKLIRGRDGVTRGAKLRTGKKIIERPIQQLYPMELRLSTENRKGDEGKQNLNPAVEEFKPRQQRAAKREAFRRINDLALYDSQEF